jgi:DNA (cytosine-5)-methyltransferase 1
MKENINKLTYRDFEVVDLFCGVGGLSQGFVKEKFKVKAGIDFDNSCKYAFEKNNKADFLHRDIKTFNSSERSAASRQLRSSELYIFC